MNLKSTLFILSISISLLLSSCANDNANSQEGNKDKSTSQGVVKDQTSIDITNQGSKKKFVPTSSIVLVAKEMP